jgi:hypothetical protein
MKTKSNLRESRKALVLSYIDEQEQGRIHFLGDSKR